VEAQRTAVARFAEAVGLTVTGEFTEVETGRGSDALDRRPQLSAALAAARQQKCPVLVTMDRSGGTSRARAVVGRLIEMDHYGRLSCDEAVVIG
jgi:DNA invertase Pin-like site-specific DNA recombinase